MTSTQQAPIGAAVEASVRAQAAVRLKVGLPMMAIWAATLWYWGIPSGPGWLVAAWTVGVSHVLYAFIAFFLAKHLRPFSAEQLAVGTAILDPMMLSGWISMMDEAAGLYICFYLFTILGFGFRIGPRLMRICQISSMVSLAVVIAVAPVWRQHPILGLSFLMILFVVPLYASGLLKKLHEARVHAEHESKAKSQLLAKVSHELRTPLSGVVAAAQLISAETEDDRIAKRAETITSLSRDLLREINDLLDAAKYEAKALVLESALFDLNDVMERVRLTLASTAAAKSIRFEATIDDAVQDRIQGDSHYLSRVLINLAGNAVKFTEKGKVEVTAKLLEEQADSYRIRFSVQDTGIGIAPELHQQIFEPFFQASAGTTRQYGGTGLGMSISREIIALMGGEIRVESELGKGSLFYFDLKLPKVSKARLEVISTPSIQAVYGKRVLVADDNATNVTLLKELLERDKHEVTVAYSGEEALDYLNSGEYDVIFLDYNMGDIDGAKVLQIYRFGKLEPAPTYFLTADVTEGTAETLRESGAVGVLHKPISTDGLRQAIAQVCERDSGVASPSQQKPAQAPLKAVSIQYLDHSVIDDLRAMSDRPEFLGHVLSDAADDIERNCNNLIKALLADDIKQVHDTAHALKGVSASVGAARLASLAGKLMRVDRWELKQTSDRWKTDIAEAKNQSLSAIRNIIPDRTARP
ncbi:MAG TPA: ATP-binding protein [Burkholderiales bacterium]|nr:ATP-binding protein [Burkholderiales bacterium]